jgi:hypothetical protein
MRLSKEQSRQRWGELRQILCEWDPIGVMEDAGWPRDEYDAYVGPILRYLEEGAPEEAISGYLDFVVTEAMGLSVARSASREFAARIAAWFRERWADPFP